MEYQFLPFFPLQDENLILQKNWLDINYAEYFLNGFFFLLVNKVCLRDFYIINLIYFCISFLFSQKHVTLNYNLKIIAML